MSLILKKILIVVLGLAVVFLILVLAVAGKDAWGSYKWQKSVEKWEESLRKPYKEDIYGGKTPEETWAMFLDALKKGDIELASKYFAVEKQEEYKKDLEKAKMENKLGQWIKEMEGLRKSKNQPLSEKETYYSYDVFSDEYKQVLTNRVVFYLNPYTKFWKILVL